MITYITVNLFQANVQISIPPENRIKLEDSDISRGYRNGALA